MFLDADTYSLQVDFMTADVGNVEFVRLKRHDREDDLFLL